MNHDQTFEVMPFSSAAAFGRESRQGESGYEYEDEGEYEGEDGSQGECGGGRFESEYEGEGEYEGEDEYEYVDQEEGEYETPGGSRSRFVTDFSGPAAECTLALRRAGKTRAQALAIVNTQIGAAVVMLRKAAADLQYGKRSQATRNLFLKIFRVRPEFVPTWFKPTPSNRDRGDVVRIRCAKVADLLASGGIKFFCTINATNCPECGNDTSPFACSSFGKHRVICLGDAFWSDMKAGRTTSMLSTLMHEPFHIYFGRTVTEHRSTAGKFGGINCLVRFAFEANRRTAPARVTQRCTDMAVRQELETSWS